jgi:hypothetical protein
MRFLPDQASISYPSERTSSSTSASDLLSNLTVDTGTGYVSYPAADGDLSSQAASDVTLGEVARELGFAPPGVFEAEDIQIAFRRFQGLVESLKRSETRPGADLNPNVFDELLAVFSERIPILGESDSDHLHPLDDSDSLHCLLAYIKEVQSDFQVRTAMSPREMETALSFTIFRSKLRQRYSKREWDRYEADTEPHPTLYEFRLDCAEALSFEVQSLAELYSNRQE